MMHFIEESGIQVQKDIPVQCLNCGTDFAISREEIETGTSNDHGPQGYRIYYYYDAECCCPNCGNRITYSQQASEYPEGAIEFIDKPRCSGGIIFNVDIDMVSYDDEFYISEYGRYYGYRESNPEKIPFGQQLNIDAYNGDGFLLGKNSPQGGISKIWVNPAGQLLPILVDETGSIRFDENKAVFAAVLSQNPNADAMKLLGKVAEAVIVRRCAENKGNNKTWLTIGRQGRTIQRIADSFRAIGTGLNSTKRNYPHKYDPGNPQRDIIWIDQNGNCALKAGAGYAAGSIAGLQVKVSGNGPNYVQKALVDHRYEVPMVYFPMNNDYDLILDHLFKRGIQVNTEWEFIDARNVDMDAYDEVKYYYPLLLGLFKGTISADAFVQEATGIIPIRNSIIASTLSSPQTNTRIIL